MTIYDEIACLQEVAPFAALSPNKQKLLAVVSEHAVYMAGDVIIEQRGTPAMPSSFCSTELPRSASRPTGQNGWCASSAAMPCSVKSR